ncbi:pectate lyase [Flavobacterium sp. SE-1-e]|uniref:Pectate lyase n=2 Tax=Flavobacterium agrisoli TaxID=2793066 RepID=A0A934PKA3_9FLAO|nr:pectate lyase [Flavobacterium agrisoli]
MGCFQQSIAQKKSQNTVVLSTKPFSDGVNHWYHIKDKHNIVNPIENQPQYAESEYEKIADNILLFQKENGGWPKNYDMRAILTKSQKQEVLAAKSATNTTFDNATTYTHIAYLAQVYTLSKAKKYKEGFDKGIEFIMQAQYPNGGWPQYYPLESNYSRHITFNDGAYMGIMQLLQQIVRGDADYTFIDANLKAKVQTSYQKGIECILNMQIKDNNKLTVWCQQHDEVTLAPAWARKFEPPSICNAESVPVVLFLMEQENPDQKMIQCIQSAVRWFEDSKIYNTRVERFEIAPTESAYKKITHDVRVVTDSTAAPIWTRYYELGTHRPLFCNRDSKFVYSLAEVELERREGYAWYTNQPQKVLKAYPKWQQKWAPNEDVLK